MSKLPNPKLTYTELDTAEKLLEFQEFQRLVELKVADEISGALFLEEMERLTQFAYDAVKEAQRLRCAEALKEGVA